MNSPNVLLCTLNAKYIHTNLAVRLLYSLYHKEHLLSWKEFTIKENREEIAEYCSHFDVVAFSCYIWNISQTLETAVLIKKINPHTKVLLGGPEVSYDWEDVIAKPQVDYIITGEGEIPFGEFLKNFPNIQHVPALVWKEETLVRSNPNPSLFDINLYEDLMPYSFDNPDDLKNKVLYIETSRGCPYKCAFCLASLDNKVRYLPDAHIKNTLLFLMENGKVIKFLDRTFNVKKDFTLDIFKFILTNKKPGNVFQFEITADILHPDIIQFINDEVPKNLFRFEIGIQTVNQKANLAVSRKQNFERTKSIIKKVENKVELHLDLIVGMAHDYWNDIKYSFEETFQLFAPELQLGFLKFLKGTPVRYSYKEHDFVFDPQPPYQIIQSKYLSKEELDLIVNLEHALEVYWNNKRALHTLRYVSSHYSIFDFLTGLGTYFKQVSHFHKFSLFDIYRILDEFTAHHFPQDSVIKQFIAIDYYLHFKVKPGEMILKELPSEEKNKIIQSLRLNQQKNRFIVLPLSFNYTLAQNSQIIENSPQNLIIQYNGKEKAQILDVVVA